MNIVIRNYPILLIALFFSATAIAQEPLLYKSPPQDIVDLVDGPRLPSIRISPDKTKLILLENAGYPSIEELREEELRLAGIRINPNNFGPSRSSYNTGISVRSLDDPEEKPPKGLNSNMRITELSFSPSGDKIAFINRTRNDLQLWVIHLNDLSAIQLADGLNSVIGAA